MASFTSKLKKWKKVINSAVFYCPIQGHTIILLWVNCIDSFLPCSSCFFYIASRTQSSLFVTKYFTCLPVIKILLLHVIVFISRLHCVWLRIIVNVLLFMVNNNFTNTIRTIRKRRCGEKYDFCMYNDNIEQILCYTYAGSRCAINCAYCVTFGLPIIVEVFKNMGCARHSYIKTKKPETSVDAKFCPA